MQTATTKRTQNLILFLGIIVLFSTVSFAATNTAFLVTNEIYQCVTIGALPVGGLTAAQAEAKISSAYNAVIEKQPVITLHYQGSTWTIMASDIDLTLDSKLLAEQAYQIGRTGNLWNQLRERYLAVNRGVSLPLAISYNAEKLNRRIAEIASGIDREPQSASILYEGSKVQIVPETIGLKLDTAAVAAEITKRLTEQLPTKAELIVSEICPVIRTADLKNINSLLASYSTQFDSSDQNRSQNIYLAANSINGTLVKKGQVFSFNTHVGPRLDKNGYKEAPVFIEGKLVPDLGGGVCQVSSTLYNAILLADLDIVERTAHFRPPGYVPLGQDATVADNLLDFRFKNTSADNIYIASHINGSQLTVYVYGLRSGAMPEIKIISGESKVLEPNTIVKQDPALEFGQQVVEIEGQKGFYVTTYRVKTVDGREINREFLAADEFKPIDRIIRVGSKEAKSTK